MGRVQAAFESVVNASVVQAVENINALPHKNKKAFLIEIKFDAPYPQTWHSKTIQARSVERAVVFATRAFKKTRPRKRMPKVLTFRTEQIN